MGTDPLADDVPVIRIDLVGADCPDPIPMTARRLTEPGTGLPVVEYQHAATIERDSAMPTVLCFAGGGCSGASLAALAQAGAERGLRMISFDMPGHTPIGLLAGDTPPRSLLSRTSMRVRAGVTNMMVARWAGRSTQLQVLSHSAGFLDVASINHAGRQSISGFLICGAPIPGMGAMVAAARASTLGGSAEPVSLAAIVRDRVVPTGLPSDHYGARNRSADWEATLAGYQSPEHLSVALALFSSRQVRRQDWRGRSVVMIGSAGDGIAPPDRIATSATRMRTWGADASAHILREDLPHMFLSFHSAAAAVASIAAAADSGRPATDSSRG